MSADETRRFCSASCRHEHEALQAEPGTGDAESGDGVFTAQEHATWDANLAALNERVRTRRRTGPLVRVVGWRGDQDKLSCGHLVPSHREVKDRRRCGECRAAAFARWKSSRVPRR